MIKSILRLAALLVVGILVYNYFLGTPEEQAQSKKIFSKVTDLGQDAWSLLRAEKEKLDEGKYDEALDKITALIDKLKVKAKDIEDSGIIDQIAELENKRENLERKLQEYETPTSYDDQGNQLTRKGPAPGEKEMKDDFEQLIQDTEKVMKEMEGNQ